MASKNPSSKRRSIPRTFADSFGPLKSEFHAAQGGICPLCGHQMDDMAMTNYDHVKTHKQGGKIYGNVLLTHIQCNSKRPGSQEPCEAYLEILKIVNDRLGYDSAHGYTKTYRYHEKMLEKAVVSLHWKYGIKIARQSKMWRLFDVKADDLSALVEHLHLLLVDAVILPSIVKGKVRFNVKHHGLRPIR